MNAAILEIVAHSLAAIVGIICIIAGLSSTAYIGPYAVIAGALIELIIWFYLTTTAEMLQITRAPETQAKYALCCKVLHNAIMWLLLVNVILISIMAFE